MKVRELIEELQKCNPDAEVVLDDADSLVEVDYGNPSSCAASVILIGDSE